MTNENITLIEANIARYRAMLKLDMNRDWRSVVERLLTEASDELALATESKKQHWRRA